ncbi:MAG: PH domain-containing protein [Armatimonadetes bacterium]|nr:PH domain-containing protein [Armatimonadota bacterium]
MISAVASKRRKLGKWSNLTRMDGPPPFEEEEYRHVGWAPLARQAIRVTAGGLVEVFFDGRELVTPWHEVVPVVPGEDSSEIRLPTRTLWLDDGYGDWRRLAQRIQELAYPALPPQRGSRVPPEQIAAWLGIPPGGALVCRNRISPMSILGMLVLVWSFYLLLDLSRGHPWGAAWMLPIYAYAAVRAFLQAELVVADANGLTVRRRGRRRRYAWSDVESIMGPESGREVRAAGERFTIGTNLRHAETLAATIRLAVRAQRNGLVLPTAPPIPDGAISRMTGDEEDATADRGISISPDQP